MSWEQLVKLTSSTSPVKFQSEPFAPSYVTISQICPMGRKGAAGEKVAEAFCDLFGAGAGIPRAELLRINEKTNSNGEPLLPYYESDEEQMREKNGGLGNLSL